MVASSPSHDLAPSDSLRETAALWCDRLNRDEVSEETRAAFQRWCDEAPEHRTAYETVARTWASAQRGAEDPRILALRHETALRLTRQASRWSRARTWTVAAVVLVIVSAAVGLALQSQLVSRMAADRSPVGEPLDSSGNHEGGRYVTATGERLTVTLDDGSRVTLNTQTELESAFNAAERKVSLTRGQALFEVAKDPARPFVVEAQDRRFVAVGTAFDVRVDGERVQVTMVEGTVKVERMSPAQLRGGAMTEMPTLVTTLTAGEQLTVDAERLERVRVADMERVTSWRRGQVIFEDARLVDAIAELNRYSETRIELADPALAELRLSGAFATGRPTVFVEALTTYFPVEVTEADDEVIVLSARD